MTSEREPILPSLPTGESWDVIDFRNIRDAQLKPFQIIPVPSIREFDLVEAGICHSIKTMRDGRGPEYTLAQEGRIAKDRISNHLRPRGFGGSLVGGQVVLLPFNTEYAQRWAERLSHDNIRRAEPEHSLNVLYTGALKSTRAGMLGQVCLEAAYYELQSGSRWRTGGNINHLRRLLGPAQHMSETELSMEEMLQQNAEASRLRAQKLTATALRHAYSAGAFGQGKRR